MVNAYKLYYYNSAQGEMMNYTICEMDSFSVIKKYPFICLTNNTNRTNNNTI